MTEPATDLCYPILTPFKFEDVIVKPPAFIQLSDEEAAPLIAAGVISDDAALSPDEAAAASIEIATATDTDAKTSETNPADRTSAGAAKPAARVVHTPAARKTTARKTTARKTPK